MASKKEQKMDIAGDIGDAIFELFSILIEKIIEGVGFLVYKLLRLIFKPKQAKIKRIEQEDLDEDKTTTKADTIGYSITRKKVINCKELDRIKHILVCGPTGFGKTVLFDNLIEHDLKQGKPLIFIDPKADNQSLIQFMNLCKKTGREFQVFSEYYDGPESISLNPVKDGTPTQLADRIHASFDWSDEHYETLCYTALKKSCEAIVNEKKIPTYKRILEKVINITKIPDARITKIKDVEGIIVRLDNLVSSDFGKYLGDDGFSMHEIWKQKKSIYIGLPVLGYPKAARSLSRIFYSDISHSIYSTYQNLTYKNDNELSPFSVYLDELSAVISDQFIELLNKCRGAKMEMVMGFQCPSDISKVNPFLLNQLLENTSTWVIFKQRLEIGANLFSSAIGTTEGKKQTVRVEDGEEQSLGSQRQVQQMLAHSNIIKNLNQGQAVLLQHNPTRVDLVNIRYINPYKLAKNMKSFKEKETFNKKEIVSEERYFEHRKSNPTVKKNTQSVKLSVIDKKVLQIIGEWKVISIKDLFDLLVDEKHLTNLHRRVRNLEKDNYIEQILKEHKEKYLILTEKSLLFTTRINEISKNYIHDLICTLAVKTLASLDLFRSGSVFDADKYEIDPDGIVYFKEGDFKTAIEVELTQKSENRVLEKFVKYSKEKALDFVIYIIKEEKIYIKYKSILAEMNNEIKDKIIISLDQKLAVNYYKPLDAFYWFQDKLWQGNDLFNHFNKGAKK